jgi:hypothetical protein
MNDKYYTTQAELKLMGGVFDMLAGGFDIFTCAMDGMAA